MRLPLASLATSLTFLFGTAGVGMGEFLPRFAESSEIGEKGATPQLPAAKIAGRISLGD